jgi:hypothetical protein
MPSPRLTMLLPLLMIATPVFSQTRPSLSQLKKLPGATVAQAQAAAPETPLGLSGYTVRELTFGSPVKARVAGASADVTRAWHFTIAFARPLVVRDQAFTLVIDGRPAGFLQEAPDLLSADAVVFDPSVIRDGARVGVTYQGVVLARLGAGEEAVNPEIRLSDADSSSIHYAAQPLRLAVTR